MRTVEYFWIEDDLWLIATNRAQSVL
jgi:hypothetical protein